MMITPLSISEFNYDLPDASVAKYPLPGRDQSRLLQWKNHQISDHQFSDLPGLLPEGTLLVFNNTRVIRARLHFTKPTGAKIEIFCLEPTLPHDYVLSFAQTTSCRWKCLIGNLKRWNSEVLKMEVFLGETTGRQGEQEAWSLGNTERQEKGETGRSEDRIRERVVLKAEKIRGLDGGVEIEFSWDHPEYTFSELLEAAGNIPIPPYLHRESEEMDSTVYQTVYAKIKGSVAAPTAGLHFTGSVFKALAAKGIFCEELTLHVGAGTFQPVKSEAIHEHLMHTEYFSVNREMIEHLLKRNGKVIAVGTTSVRTLESLYWIGCKIISNPMISAGQLPVKQWEPYQDIDQHVEANVAMQAILDWLSGQEADILETSTQIMILPGYHCRVIDGLVTNFHQPQSTLLLLIAAILGNDWKRVYAHALAGGYRFLSYGDANLYWL